MNRRTMWTAWRTLACAAALSLAGGAAQADLCTFTHTGDQCLIKVAGALSAAAETVVLGLSQHEVAITTDFRGSHLWVFGAVRREAPMPDNQLLAHLPLYLTRSSVSHILFMSDLYRQVLEEGHSVGNHTFNHLNGWQTAQLIRSNVGPDLPIIFVSADPFENRPELLEAAGCQPQDIDLIIVATSTPDMVFPSTACIVQRKLGIVGCPAFDVQAVCSGFVYALSVADSIIRAGAARCALVIGAEVFSRILDWKDRATCVLFGDGAGAVVLSASPTPGILATDIHADGSHVDILCVPGTVSGGQILGDPLLKMDGQAVFKLAVGVLEDTARASLAKAGREAADIDWLIPHQANIRIIQATGKRLGVAPERVIATVGAHGNTSAASIPLALDAAVRDGRIRRGQKVILEGIGGGFAWGALLLEY